MKLEVEWFFTYDSLDGKTIEMLGLDPVPALKFYTDNKDSDIRRCPAYVEALKNTYVVCSPIDYDITIDRNTNTFDIKEPKLLPVDSLGARLDQAINSPYKLFTSIYGGMLFRSKDKNVWMEQIDPFLEWNRSNQIRVVPGKFNIAKWHRPIDFTFEQKEMQTTIKIKRGDPLYYVRFHGEDPADIVTLKRVEQTIEDMSDWKTNVALKKYFPKTSLEFLYSAFDKFKALRNGNKSKN
jgi:hypothetical protein